MDDSDRRLLDRLQNELPLVERPWAALAADIAMPEDEMLERISRLRGEGVVRQISAIFDTRRLGYRSSLVAARTKPGTQQQAADIVSAHPGVTHNYEREHAFDLWFTIAVPGDSKIGLDETIDLLGRLADVESIRPLPEIGARDMAWEYYRRNWRPGAPHPEAWPRNYDTAMALIKEPK